MNSFIEFVLITGAKVKFLDYQMWIFLQSVMKSDFNYTLKPL